MYVLQARLAKKSCLFGHLFLTTAEHRQRR